MGPPQGRDHTGVLIVSTVSPCRADTREGLGFYFQDEQEVLPPPLAANAGAGCKSQLRLISWDRLLAKITLHFSPFQLQYPLALISVVLFEPLLIVVKYT